MRKTENRWLGLPLLMLFCLQAVTGCAPAQVRYRQEQVSREYTYIDFTQNAKPLSIVAEVGGERMSFYKVLAFQGDRFRITVVDLEGKTASVVSGEGIAIREEPDAGVSRCVVEVESLETLFSIALDAHPYGRYRLEIEKL